MRNQWPSLGALLAIPIVLGTAMISSGCFFNRPKPAAFTPPPPLTAPVDAAPEQLPEPPLVTSTPDLSDSSTGVTNGVTEAPAPPAPRTAPRRTVAAPPPAKPQAATPQPEQQPAPRLGQILSPDQIREYNRVLDESLDRVRRAVAVLGRKVLSKDQAETLNGIRVFQRQAEEAREQDLVKAVNLARRADVLAKDLQDRVQ
jgi:hypothetical protein